MIDEKPISLELKLYAAFVDGMMVFDKRFPQAKDLNQQELVNFMHAEGEKYVIERVGKK